MATISPGSGVSKKKKVLPQAQDVQVDFESDSENSKFSTKPTLKGQFRDTRLWRYGPYRAITFNLSQPKDLAAYNKLLARASSTEDPEIEITASQREFHVGAYYVFVMYRSICYKVLMTKQQMDEPKN